MNPLQKHLSETGETASNFARRIGISKSSLSRLMAGKLCGDQSIIAAIWQASNGAVTPNDWIAWWSSVSCSKNVAEK